jgi:hypothetical protein
MELQLIGWRNILAGPDNLDLCCVCGGIVKGDDHAAGYIQKLAIDLVTVHIADLLSRQRYLIRLCRALMKYGAPTHRLEA